MKDQNTKILRTSINRSILKLNRNHCLMPESLSSKSVVLTSWILTFSSCPSWWTDSDGHLHSQARELKHKLQRKLQLSREVLSTKEGPITNGPTTLDPRRVIESGARVIEDTTIEQIKSVHA